MTRAGRRRSRGHAMGAWGAVAIASLAGCVHTIHVQPEPAAPAAEPIPRHAQVVAGPPTVIGADHRPGIPLLEWPARELQEAIVRYMDRRGTFLSVGAAPADVRVTVDTILSMRYRDRYRYRIRLRAEVTEGTRSIALYTAEQEAEGSAVRWVTASDREPIKAALQAALDDLLTRMEADRGRYGPPSRPTGGPRTP